MGSSSSRSNVMKCYLNHHETGDKILWKTCELQYINVDFQEMFVDMLRISNIRLTEIKKHVNVHIRR